MGGSVGSCQHGIERAAVQVGCSRLVEGGMYGTDIF